MSATQSDGRARAVGPGSAATDRRLNCQNPIARLRLKTKSGAPLSAPPGARSDVAEDIAQEPLARLFVVRSEEHTSELQSLMRISSAVFCLKKKTTTDSKMSVAL